MKEMDSTEPQSTNVSTTPSPEVVHPVSTTPSLEVVHPDPVSTTPPSGVMKSLVLACRFALGGVGVLASSSAADVMQIGAEVQKAAEVGAAIEAMLASAMAIADLVKTTLGPKGMDKILQCVTVTNDGATILKSLHIDNPAAEVLIGYRMAADCARSALLDRV
ncbi:T-complex protein 1 subunit beta [Tanacetum coccineum]